MWLVEFEKFEVVASGISVFKEIRICLDSYRKELRMGV
jgi:hypothetical protein